MTRTTLRRAALVLAATVALTDACASGGRNADGARISPPTMLSGPRPEWRTPSPPREGRVLDMRIEVQIDSTGQPDLETLRLSGLGAGENRDAAAAWIRSARFRPAQQGGRAVPGLYQTRVQAEARIQRVSE